MILVANVTVQFDSLVALNSITLEFEKQKTHVILGSSGSGKTTLLKSILGLQAVDHGSIQIDDLEISPSVQSRVAMKTGYVIQGGGLFPHLTAFRNITLVPHLRGWEPDLIEDKVNNLSELVNLDNETLSKYPTQLSAGQQQRVGLMRALMMDPPLLIFDEPLGSLDPLIRSDLQTELKRIFKKLKKTVLLVTHDIGEAAYFGDSVSLLHKGCLVQKGTFKDLVKSPADSFVKKFLEAQKPPPLVKELK